MAATETGEDTGDGEDMDPIARGRRRSWIRYSLIALVAEKIVQHIVVTLALQFNWRDIRSTVAVDSGILMVLGGVVAVLYMLTFWGLLKERRGTLTLIVGLALFDIFGEFVAQGTPNITITVSFLVAIALLILVFVYYRKDERRTA